MKTYIVDSFTDVAFKGNPAGVCILEEDISSEKMQLIAQELGLSETAFIKKQSDGSGYSIRFFSPKMEITLCGHATLASSKVVFEETSLTKVKFLNIDGLVLSAKKEFENISMEFPVYATFPQKAPTILLQALGIETIVNSEFNKETNILLIEIVDSENLKNLNPDFQSLVNSHDSINGVLVTARSKDDEYDFHSRYFWPWSGTNEDPVTGGTHTFLAPYWSKKLNKKKLKSYQSSRRSGFMELEIISDQKLIIKSQAVIIFKGDLLA